MWRELLIALSLSAPPMESAHVPCLHDCVVSEAGQAFIKDFEGYMPYPYRDSAGKMTLGFGHLILPGENIKTPLMGEDAERLFQSDIKPAVKAVNKRVQAQLFQAQVDALVSFTFNLGDGALRSSTLLKKVNQQAHDEVPLQFIRWIYAGGKKVPGLLRRREAEAQLYRQRVY